MPSFEIQVDIFTRLSVFGSPKGSSNTFKTHKNISLYFKRRYLIIYKYEVLFKSGSPLLVHSLLDDGFVWSYVVWQAREKQRSSVFCHVFPLPYYFLI